MATTPVGNPYTESSDLLANFPGQSLALANRIDVVGVNPFANAAARDAAITSPVQGQMCSLNDDDKIYRYDGSAWVVFSGAAQAANFTNTATGTYTDGDGVDWKYLTFTGSGSLVIDVAGECRLLVLGGGCTGYSAGSIWAGKGGYSVRGTWPIAVGTYTVTVGATGPVTGTPLGSSGEDSSIGTTFVGFGGGAGGTISGGTNPSNFDDDITGTSVTYAEAGVNTAVANRGQGGKSAGNTAGSSGVVIIAVRV